MNKYVWGAWPAVLALATAAVLTGCEGKDAKDKPASATDTAATFTDSRDGKVYRTIGVGGQVWFAENLNYAAEGSVCYDGEDANCAKHGRLYNWETALKTCPTGFHLPSDMEWAVLLDYAGGDEKAGTKLRSSTGWDSFSGAPVGTDDYGFSTLPGGYSNVDGSFHDADKYGYWWSATKVNADYAWSRYMGYGYDGVYRRDDYKRHLFSVRCVQD